MCEEPEAFLAGTSPHVQDLTRLPKSSRKARHLPPSTPHGERALCTSLVASAGTTSQDPQGSSLLSPGASPSSVST